MPRKLAAPVYFSGEAAGVGDPNLFFENGRYWVLYLQNNGRHPDGRYTLDLVVDPDLGLGIRHIDDFRALSFRYYRIGTATLALFADGGFANVSGGFFTRSTDQAKENHNG